MARAYSLASGAFMLLFSIGWTVVSLSIPMPFGILFVLFGLAFIVYGIVAVARAIRLPSDGMVPRPPEVPVEPPVAEEVDVNAEYTGYCPYCGSPTESGNEFCRVCGKRLDRWRSIAVSSIWSSRF